MMISSFYIAEVENFNKLRRQTGKFFLFSAPQAKILGTTRSLDIKSPIYYYYNS